MTNLFLTSQDNKPYLTSQDNKPYLTSQDGKQYLTSQDNKPYLTPQDGYYASPSSGEAYRDRRLTTNFEL